METQELIEAAKNWQDASAQIVAMFDNLTAKVKEAQKAVNDFQKAIVSICPHPRTHRWNYTTDHDDGYGRWWKTSHSRCELCMKDLS